MKRVCTHCNRSSLDGNLWCQEYDCPAGAVPSVLDYGDTLGDIEIVRLLRMMHTGTIYHVRREGQDYLMKVAHDTHDHREYLRCEARLLVDLMQHNDTTLPVIAGAYRGVPPNGKNGRPYGQYVFRGERKVFMLFEYVQGDFLADLLLKNPEPWYNHVGWIMLRLTATIRLLHSIGYLHLNLNPEHILVSINKAGVYMPRLLDLGTSVKIDTQKQQLILPPDKPYDQALDELREQWKQFIPAAYIPPEIIDNRLHIGYTSDIYQLGLIFYEMLAGQPAFPYRLRKVSDIYEAVVAGPPPKLERLDLPALRGVSEDTITIARRGMINNMNDLAEVMLINNPQEREPKSARRLYKLLEATFDKEPEVRSRFTPSRRTIMASVTLLAILVIVILVITGLTLLSAL